MNILIGRHQFLVMAMLAAAAMLLGTAWIGDDAFISLRVIDNFVHGFGLRYNVIERVQVYTHPLWLLLLTPFYALTREAMVTTMLVSVLLSLGAMWVLATRVAKNIEYGCLIVFVVLASPVICNFSTSGLENPLTFLLLALFVWQIYEFENALQFEEAWQPKKAWIPAGMAGLLLLNRLDLAVLLGPALAYLLLRAHGGDRVKVTVAAISPALAWMVFSIIYYGAPFPNTAYAKLGTGFSAGTLILRGLEYSKDFVLTDPLLALIIAKVLSDALRFRSWRLPNLTTPLLGFGIVLYVAYIIVIGGDFMSGRFFASPGFLAICMLARARSPHWLFKHIQVVILIATGVIAGLLIVRVMEQPSFTIPANGIADERRFYYSYNGLIPVLNKWVITGTEPIHPWGQKAALKAHEHNVGIPIVALENNVGLSGYYAGSGVHIVDVLALADAFLARLPALPGARVGHYQRRLPLGYTETVLNAVPTTEIEALRPLLNDVTLVTRAPLFTKERWSAIWRLSSGHYSWVYAADIYEERK